ncbi:MAG TPA: glycosyltransferase, partial [Nitrospirota bacterium]
DEALLKAEPRIRDKVWYVGPSGGSGVDTRKYNSAARLAGREDVRQELGVGPDTLVVGYIGRLAWEKGFRELIDAAALLNGGGTARDIRYIIIGDGGGAGDIKAYANERGVGGRFVFLGYRFDVERYMAGMDIFTLPSYREGISVSLLQALAMGLPCIASDIRGNREIMRHKETGLLFPVGDASAYSGAIAGMADNREDALALGARAEKYVSENFAEEALVENVSGILARLAAERL